MGRARGIALASAVSAVVGAALGCSSESFTGADPNGDAGLARDGAANEAGASEGGASDGGAPDGGASQGGGLPCGDTSCAEPEICCADPPDASSLAAALTTGPRHCSLREKCPSTSMAIACDSPAFCARDGGAQVCCVSHVDQRFTSTECLIASACDTAGPHDILCVPGGAQCPTGSTCNRLNGAVVDFDNYLVCVR